MEDFTDLELSWLARRRIAGDDLGTKSEDPLVFPFWIFERMMDNFPKELPGVLASTRIKFEHDEMIITPTEAHELWKQLTEAG